MKNAGIVLLLTIGLLLTGCADNKGVDPTQHGTKETDSAAKKQGEAVPEAAADAVVLSLKNQDMASFSHYVHPSKGVRFSPYSYVNVNSDLLFTALQAEQLMTDTTVYHWGI